MISMAEVSPDLFLDAILGYQKTAALKAALALDLFTAISQNDGDFHRIAEHTGASARGIRILCDYLTVQGFLEKERDRYRLTPSTEVFLTTTSPAAMGSVVDFLASPEMIAQWLDDPVAYVRRGGSEGLANLAPDHPIWVKFAKAMVPLIRPAAQAVAAEVGSWPTPPRRVLDIAAGHGIFGISIAQALPGAEITAIDWQAVLAVAEENAAQAGVAKRYRTLPGSAFDVDWGDGFDLVLLTNFLHHFDEETCVRLLTDARGSLRPGGKVLAVEMVPNEDRISPPFPASFSFMMLGSTPCGDAYTARQFEEMARRAAFSATAVKALPPSPMSLVTFGL
jgi:2-polyprenyl-3-methyl-5-hydroxy-6-metoxy-1,4-benzoquinol methylase